MLSCMHRLDMDELIPYWDVMAALESRALDCFDLAGQPRPKISCWSCRRVDHILFSACAAVHWPNQHAAAYYTLASDHLPLVSWLSPTTDNRATRCPGKP